MAEKEKKRRGCWGWLWRGVLILGAACILFALLSVVLVELDIIPDSAESTATAEADAATEVALATQTTWTPSPEPTVTPTATETPVPSATPLPSDTPPPSATPGIQERAEAAIEAAVGASGNGRVEVADEAIVRVRWDVGDSFTMGMIRTGVLNDLAEITCELRGAGFTDQTYQIGGDFPSVDDLGNEGVMEVVSAIVPPNLHSEINCDNRLAINMESALNRFEGANLFLHPEIREAS